MMYSGNHRLRGRLVRVLRPRRASFSEGQVASCPWRGASRGLDHAARAFSLVEVAIAVGIVGFCVLAILGLYSLGWRNARDSIEEFRAGQTASSLLARMRAAPTEDLTAEGFPFGPLTNSGGSLFDIPNSAPLFLKGDGTKAATQSEAVSMHGYALAGSGTFDATTRMANVSFTLWWPAGASFSNAMGRWSTSTFIETEAP